MRNIIFLLLLALGGCGRNQLTIYVHYESPFFEKDYGYKITLDERTIITDTLKYSSLVPNFNAHVIEPGINSIELQVDSMKKAVPALPDVKYFSFFIFTDTSAGMIRERIIVRTYTKRPVFR